MLVIKAMIYCDLDGFNEFLMALRWHGDHTLSNHMLGTCSTSRCCAWKLFVKRFFFSQSKAFLPIGL